MIEDIKAVYVDIAVDLSASMDSLLGWVKQYIAVFINEAARDFPNGEAGAPLLLFGFTVFYQNIVEYILFEGQTFTGDYETALAFAGSLSAKKEATGFVRNVGGAVNASLAKLAAKSVGKHALLVFSDAYESPPNVESPVGAVDVACVFATEKLSENSGFLKAWQYMHQQKAEPLAETEKPDFKVICWSEGVLGSWDEAYAAMGGSRAGGLSSNYPMKAWVQDSAYSRIKQFITITYTGNF